MEGLGEHIRKLRKRRGFSIGELARESGVSKPGILNIESNPSPNPRIDTLVKLAAGLGLPVYVPLPGGHGPHPEVGLLRAADLVEMDLWGHQLKELKDTLETDD